MMRNQIRAAIITGLLFATRATWAQDAPPAPPPTPPENAGTPTTPAPPAAAPTNPPPTTTEPTTPPAATTPTTPTPSAAEQPPPAATPEPTPAAPAPAPAPAAEGSFVLGGSSEPTRDTGVKDADADADEQTKQLPWHGSVFFVDQSVTTQTIGIGSDYQSRNPTYELWYSFRPRYYFFENDVESFNVNLRFDATHELTNSDATTNNHEFLLGDAWINAVYSRSLYQNKAAGYQTKLALGPRAIAGISKTSRGRGTIAQVGGTLRVDQTLPLAGPKAKFFPSVSFNGAAAYTKHLNRCTTACDPDLEYIRQDTDARSFASTDLSGSAMTSHQLLASLAGELQIVEKVQLGLSYIWVFQWTHSVDDNATVTTATGPVKPGSIENAKTNRVSPWIIANVDYDVLDELSLSLGYYNYTGQLGPDGERRNPLWSPEARFFFTATANLDAIYLTATGARPKETAQRKPQMARVSAH